MKGIYRYAPRGDRWLVLVVLALRPAAYCGLLVWSALDKTWRRVVLWDRQSRDLRNWYRNKKGLKL